MADISKATNVRHLVYFSAIAAGTGKTATGHFDSKSAIEAHIRGLGIGYTIIRPSTFMEILALPGMGLELGKLNFFMHPNQTMQFIAVDDIGKIVSQNLQTPPTYSGHALDIAGDALTGEGVRNAMSRALGRPLVCSRFSEELLSENRFLAGLTALVDDGRLAGSADIASLRRMFSNLMTFTDWLSGPGQGLHGKAVGDSAQSLPLR